MVFEWVFSTITKLFLPLSIDIQATVNSIQIGGADDSGSVVTNGGETRECPPTDNIDYEKTESEVEAIMQDSIEEFYSFSDSDQN